MIAKLFKTRPLYTKHGIPIFSESDYYSSNYDTISNDHITMMEADGVQPFMEETLIDCLTTETVEFVHNLCPHSERALDVGVGLGELISHLNVGKKFGVDISMTYLRQAKKRNVTVALSRLEELPYSDDQFDLVTCTDVLEHVFDYFRCIHQIARVLKPGGLLVIRTPYKENLDAYREAKQYPFVHVQNFDLSALRVHFESLLGLEYVDHAYMGTAYRGWKTSVFEDIILNKAEFEKWTSSLKFIQNDPAKSLISSSHFDYDSIMNDISIHEPENFNAAVKMLTRPVEICVAFRRPSEPDAFSHSVLATHFKAGVAPQSKAPKSTPFYRLLSLLQLPPLEKLRGWVKMVMWRR